MKKLSRKTIACIVLHATFSMILIAVFIFDRANFLETLKTILTPMCVNILGYGSLRVLNAWQKSTNYNWQQDENMKDENTKNELA